MSVSTRPSKLRIEDGKESPTPKTSKRMMTCCPSLVRSTQQKTVFFYVFNALKKCFTWMALVIVDYLNFEPLCAM